MRRAFNNPVGQASPLAAFAAEPVTSTRSVRRLARLLSLVLPAAVLVLWAGPALAQTVTLEHTGSATVKDGKIQLVEGGASTTFRVSLNADFISDLKTAYPIATTTGTQLGMQFWTFRSSSDVGWTTSGTSFIDRTTDYGIKHSGTSLKSYYTNTTPVFGEALAERLLSHIPLDSTNTDGSTATFAAIDSFAVNSFPNTFTIQADTDSVYFEREESIRVKVAVMVLGHGAQPAFSSFFIFSDELTFDLVDGALPDPTGKPTTPANLEATAGKGAVTLTWDAVDDTSSNTNLLNDVQITKHQVRQTTDGDISDETWTDIPDSAYGGVNANTHTIGSLTDGTEYTFQVRAVNGCTTTTGCGESDPATAVMATPDAGALTQPTGLMAAAGNTEVTLTWTDPGNATVVYWEYQQKKGSAAFEDWTEIPDSTATTTSYRVTGLDNGTAYSYRIRAGRGAETSPASDAVTATPRGVPPAAPVLTATPRDSGVTLSWPNPVDASIQRWDYQYKTGTGVYQPWQTARELDEEDCEGSTRSLCAPPYLRTTSGATVQFAVGSLTNGTAYTFRIRAVNADGSATSNEASATPVAGVPAKPTGVTTRLNSDGDQRILEWDRAADPSILRYEFTTDEGRTWSLLVSAATASSGPLPAGQFLSGYTIRIRAVNAAGPGPASEPAVEDAAGVPALNVSLQWDASTKKATLVWDETEDANLQWWSIFFLKSTHSGSDAWDTDLPIGTTRYEIPATFEAGATINVWITGCVRTGCGTTGQPFRFEAGGPNTVVTGFTATAGDGEVTLAWDAPTDSGITHFEYAVSWWQGISTGVNVIPDGTDMGNSAADETSHTVKAIHNASHVTDGTAPINGELYRFRLRAANANGGGPWSEEHPLVIPLAAGVPAAPSGVVTLLSGPEGGGHGHGHATTPALTIWDDPRDPSITGYQRQARTGTGHPYPWEDIPGTDATTTGVEGRLPRLRAVNANGWGPWTEVTVVVSPTPARPTGLQAAPGNGRVTLTWDDPGRDVYIEFYRYTTDGGETWIEIPDSESTAEGQLTRYTVPNLTNGDTYTFAVVAENDTGTSPPSAAVTATPRGGAPAKPTGLSAAPGNAEATLTWDNPIDASITKYQVKQDAANWADIAGSDVNTTSHTVGPLTNGTAYMFQIRAVNDHNGDSTDDPGAASDAVTVTPGVPTAPASLVAVPGNTQEVTLTWTARTATTAAPSPATNTPRTRTRPHLPGRTSRTAARTVAPTRPSTR